MNVKNALLSYLRSHLSYINEVQPFWFNPRWTEGWFILMPLIRLMRIICFYNKGPHLSCAWLMTHCEYLWKQGAGPTVSQAGLGCSCPIGFKGATLWPSLQAEAHTLWGSSSSKNLHTLKIYLYISVCITVGGGVDVSSGAWGGRIHQLPMELEFQEELSAAPWVLRTDLGSFVRAISTLNLWAIFLALLIFLKDLVLVFNLHSFKKCIEN